MEGYNDGCKRRMDVEFLKSGYCRWWLSSSMVLCEEEERKKSISDLRAVGLSSVGTSAWPLRRLFNGCDCWGWDWADIERVGTGWRGRWIGAACDYMHSVAG